jgi:hypothetical protein
MLGAYSYLIELWGSPAFAADINDDGRVSDEERLLWVDTELMGEGWIEPHKVNHPDLGEIWIGGTTRKHIGRTPPARYIEYEAQRNANFVLYCASQFPKVEFGEVKVTPSTDDLFWIEVEVKNEKAYPTSSDRAVALKRAVMDKITVSGSGGLSLIEVPATSTAVDPLNPGRRSDVIVKKGTEFRLRAKETKTFCALVRMNGSSGSIEFTVKSKNGGTAVKKVNLKVN